LFIFVKNNFSYEFSVFGANVHVATYMEPFCDWRTGVFAQVHHSVPYQFAIDFLK